MLKDLLTATVGKCYFCKKTRILDNGVCGSCLKNIEEQENHESGVDWDSRNEDDDR